MVRNDSHLCPENGTIGFDVNITNTDSVDYEVAFDIVYNESNPRSTDLAAYPMASNYVTDTQSAASFRFLWHSPQIMI